jgi:hypothetical protein
MRRIRVLLGLAVISFLMMIRGSAMRLGRLVVMICGFVMVVLRQYLPPLLIDPVTSSWQAITAWMRRGHARAFGTKRDIRDVLVTMDTR